MGHRLQKIIIFTILAIHWMACERSVEFNPINFGRASLEVVWIQGTLPHSSYKDSAKVRLYDNEEEFRQAGGRYVAERSLSDRYPQGGGTITPVDRAQFQNLAPGAYWVKVFNASRHERLIEHNLDAGFRTSHALNEHTHNSVSVKTSSVYLREYRIHAITFHTIPMADRFRLPDRSFQLDIDKWYFSSSSNPNVKYYTGAFKEADLPFTIEGLAIHINEFGGWYGSPEYYINLLEGGFGQYEINVFNLLNRNTDLSGELHYWDEQNRKIFTLHGTFTLQNQQ